jgi:hypothetical protein
VTDVPQPTATRSVTRSRTEITVDDVPKPVTTRIIIRPSVFDLYGKE